jgi:LysR family transcriptional regulator, regulator for genes of the gallate degradation pathway
MGDLSLAQAGLGVAREIPAIAQRLTLLRCLAAVAAHGSTLRAAEAVFLSQPAVTRAVLELEKMCGMALFERGARGMVATVAGARAAQRAESLFNHLAQGAAEAAKLGPARQRQPAMPLRFAGAVTSASLKALVAVAANGTEAKAAQWLGVSQPAVHRSLRALEHLAGVELLHRSVRGTRLTDGGEALLLRAKLAFAEARAMESDLAAWRGEIRGRVVVGALPLSVTLFLPQAVHAVRSRHPEIQVTVVDGTYESLMRQLHHADVDAIVGALRPAPAGVGQELLFQDDLAVMARAGHPCFGQVPPRLCDLLQWEWVVPLAGTPASAALRRAFASEGLEPPSDALQSNNAPFTRTLLRDTDRLALTSYGQALEDEHTGLFRRVPVTLPGTTRPIGLAVRDIGTPSSDLAVVLQALRDATALWRRPGAGHKQNEYLGGPA